MLVILRLISFISGLNVCCGCVSAPGRTWGAEHGLSCNQEPTQIKQISVSVASPATKSQQPTNQDQPTKTNQPKQISLSVASPATRSPTRSNKLVYASHSLDHAHWAVKHTLSLAPAPLSGMVVLPLTHLIHKSVAIIIPGSAERKPRRTSLALAALRLRTWNANEGKAISSS